MSHTRLIEREIRPEVHREPNGRSGGRPVLITGGAGFIGCNVAHRLLSQGRTVLIYDNLSRAGVEKNLRWLRDTHGTRLEMIVGDVRDAATLRRAIARAGMVYHFAAQVAVTTSLLDPVEDFEVNARGTLNVLEAIRAQDEPPPLLFTSTNKVYGALEDVTLTRTTSRYAPRDRETRQHGVGEDRPLDFHSPYGCSKGTADQYVLDYARSYGMRTAVFRMSCIYGPHQFGTEDQGWVAHFLIRALEGRPIVLYGDGRQVRDILFVEDLVDAFMLAQQNMDRVSGQAFNIGGGVRNTVSLLELIERIEELHGDRVDIAREGWRTGDQRYFVADTRLFEAATGWQPRVTASAGVARLYEWLLETREPTSRVAAARSVLRPTAAAAGAVSPGESEPKFLGEEGVA
jgi:CDP-paratose 2-epimerase